MNLFRGEFAQHQDWPCRSLGSFYSKWINTSGCKSIHQVSMQIHAHMFEGHQMLSSKRHYCANTTEDKVTKVTQMLTWCFNPF